MMSSHKHVVIVTGGSRGLGLALISDLLAEGYRVATCSRKKTVEIDKLESYYKATCAFLWTASEMGIEKEEQAFFDHVVSWAGEDWIYGLVNNAAITGEGILATFPNVDSERIIAVNLLSALRLSRLTLRVMLQHGAGGRIVNISSIVGLRGYTGLAAYSVSKAGMDGLTRSLAREVGRRGVTVNSVAPGYLETELSAGLGEAQRKQIINRTPVGRLGSVADVTPLVRFLLRAEAGFITGQTLVVDGGLSC
jgi:3-oxoacyl-[acyl-carrier protein] reductase